MSIKSIIAKAWQWLRNAIAQDVPGDIDIDGDKPDMPSDDVPYDDLDVCYGGFFAPYAERSDDVRIMLDSVGQSGLRYHFVRGDLRAISPANSHTNPDCVACLFCRVDRQWRGGKFDWISSDRLTRDFANIFSGYHGWRSTDIAAADAYAFVIVSGSGILRTNVSFLIRD